MRREAFTPPRFGTPDPVIPPRAPGLFGAPRVTPDYAATGATLTCDRGLWVGDATITYAFQWLRNGAPIGGATSSTYIRQAADEGNELSCQVTATNSSGSRRFVAGVASRPLPFSPPVSGPTGGTARLLALFDPGYPVLQADPWIGNTVGILDFGDFGTYPGGVLPADGETVAAALAQPPTLIDASRYGTSNLPTFDATRGGVRFASASSQVLNWSGITNPEDGQRFQSSDLALTIACVAIPASTVSGTVTPFEVSKHDTTPSNDTRERAAFQLTASAINFVCHGNTGDGTVATGSGATVAVTPTADTPFIAIGRHGSTGAPDFVNRLTVRQGGTTATSATPTTPLVLNTASTARWDGATIGARYRGGMGQFFNGTVLYVRAWNRYLSDTEVTDIVTMLRSRFGVA